VIVNVITFTIFGATPLFYSNSTEPLKRKVLYAPNPYMPIMVFKRYKHNPIIKPRSTKAYTYNPTAMVHANKVYLVYRDESDSRVSQLCLAVSDDGYTFTPHKHNPIIKPTIPEEKGGCEDPRITKIGNTFYLLYTSYNGAQPITSQAINESVATSTDGTHWKKKGILIKGLKSAALFPEKINNKYILCIGGENIKVAESTDLHNWKVDDKPILDVRVDRGKHNFDNRYVEVGPPPFTYKDVIVFFFNVADKQGTFYTSLALLDKSNPRNVLYRADKPVMTPTEEYEKKGHVKNVMFGSGLIEFKGTYFYYYGGADNYVCVATISKKELEKYIDSLM
jgi:predicted GH43/DUF377 family glycosyl hydrolase